MFKGKHAPQDNYCRATWGTCDVRSNQPGNAPNETDLPHVCADALPHPDGYHYCSAPGCTGRQTV